MLATLNHKLANELTFLRILVLILPPSKHLAIHTRLPTSDLPALKALPHTETLHLDPVPIESDRHLVREGIQLFERVIGIMERRVERVHREALDPYVYVPDKW